MGDNVYLGDRNGVRTPMQWSADRNAGFSPAIRSELYLPVIIDPEYHLRDRQRRSAAEQPQLGAVVDEAPDWAAQALPGIRTGQLRALEPKNHQILAFIREYGNERILVVANLSRYTQMVHLDLAEFRG